MLENFNYKPSEKTDRRRQVLKQAIQTTSFDTIFLALKKKREEMKGYKEDRIQYDLNWLKKNSYKYHTQVLDPEVAQENKISN